MNPRALGGTLLKMIGSGLAFTYMGLYWLGLFPDVLVSGDGLETKSVFPRRRYRWPEVAGIVERPGRFKLKAVLIHRKRRLLNRLFGLAEDWREPAILVSAQADNLQALEAAIQSHLHTAMWGGQPAALWFDLRRGGRPVALFLLPA